MQALNRCELPWSAGGGASRESVKAIVDWDKDAAAGVHWVPPINP